MKALIYILLCICVVEANKSWFQLSDTVDELEALLQGKWHIKSSSCEFRNRQLDNWEHVAGLLFRIHYRSHNSTTPRFHFKILLLKLLFNCVHFVCLIRLTRLSKESSFSEVEFFFSTSILTSFKLLNLNSALLIIISYIRTQRLKPFQISYCFIRQTSAEFERCMSNQVPKNHFSGVPADFDLQRKMFRPPIEISIVIWPIVQFIWIIYWKIKTDRNSSIRLANFAL